MKYPFLLQKMSGDILTANVDKNDRSMITVQLKDPAFKSRMLREISDSHFDIDSFYVNEPSLNDIFVQYTEVAV